MLRSVAAVVAGYFVITILMLIVIASGVAGPVEDDAALPPLALAWGFVAALAGGAVTAVIGRRSPLIHAMVLAMLGVVSACVSLFLRPPNGMGAEIASIVIPTAGVLVGGWLGGRWLALPRAGRRAG
jgi:hypothetical protein